jgi:hypothetical protein
VSLLAARLGSSPLPTTYVSSFSISYAITLSVNEWAEDDVSGFGLDLIIAVLGNLNEASRAANSEYRLPDCLPRQTVIQLVAELHR